LHLHFTNSQTLPLTVFLSAHIVNIVTFATGQQYVCDSAFGGDGPTRPLPLISGQITPNLGSQEVRLVYSPIAQIPARPSGHQKFWIYQYRNSEAAEWNSFYCFTATEFMTQDFDAMNFYASEGHPFQRTTILIVKFLRDNCEGKEEEGVEDSKIVGKLMMVNGAVKRNLGGKTEIVQVCKNEDERIEALKQWFGITMTDEERQGIKGLVTELREGVDCSVV
jgi:arylamine N-acetyltransferase